MQVFPVRVLIVANSRMFCEGLAFTLASDCGFEVVHTAVLADVRIAIGTDPVTVAVVTWDRTEQALAEFLASLDGLAVATPIVVLAEHAPTVEEAAYMSNRVAGIVAKHKPVSALVHAVRAAASAEAAAEM